MSKCEPALDLEQERDLFAGLLAERLQMARIDAEIRPAQAGSDGAPGSDPCQQLVERHVGVATPVAEGQDAACHEALDLRLDVEGRREICAHEAVPANSPSRLEAGDVGVTACSSASEAGGESVARDKDREASEQRLHGLIPSDIACSGLETDEGWDARGDLGKLVGLQHTLGVGRIVEDEWDVGGRLSCSFEIKNGFFERRRIPIGKDNLDCAGLEMSCAADPVQRKLRGGKAGSDLEGEASFLAGFSKQLVDAEELVFGERVELACRAVGVDSIDARGDEESELLGEQAEIDGVACLNGKQQRGVGAANLHGGKGSHNGRTLEVRSGKGLLCCCVECL